MTVLFCSFRSAIIQDRDLRPLFFCGCCCYYCYYCYYSNCSASYSSCSYYSFYSLFLLLPLLLLLPLVVATAATDTCCLLRATWYASTTPLPLSLQLLLLLPLLLVLWDFMVTSSQHSGHRARWRRSSRNSESSLRLWGGLNMQQSCTPSHAASDDPF